jgi:DNA-binding NtrC family response regulator
MHRAVLLSTGTDIGPEALRMPDGSRMDQTIIGMASGPAAQAVIAAEGVTRNMVGRTVAEVEQDLILDTLDHCLGNRTHAANILGISIRTLRNKLRQYASEGVDIPQPGEGKIAS